VLPKTAPQRIAGYAPIADYAAIGNQRTAALVALDGSIDWMCLPAFDSASTFAALLDSSRGGSFSLRPRIPFEAGHGYIEDTNVLQTTFQTASGTVRVTDAVTLESRERAVNEVVRRAEGLAGTVPMQWAIEARPGWGSRTPELRRDRGATILAEPQATSVVGTWGAGEPEGDGASLRGEFELRDGDTALIAFSSFHRQPPSVWPRRDLERRLDETIDFWQRLAGRCEYDGPWREAVVRSALALHLLVYRESGAIVAAPTTSLPEQIGSDRNWDYRYAWLRDTSFALGAMLRLGYREQVHASLSWAMRATAHTHPRLHVYYGLEGEPLEGVQELPLDGYRASRPVRCGNSAGAQLQLGNYGDLFDTAWQYVGNGHVLDEDTGVRLSEVADFVCGVWANPDSGIWELDQRRHYTEGKFACWVTLDRAVRLARLGQIPTSGAERWSATAAEVKRFIDERCWSEERASFTRFAGTTELDAAVLLLPRAGYLEKGDPRIDSTIEAIRAELGEGPLLYRYSGMRKKEGAFVACSFWLVEALLEAGRMDEAGELMDELVGLSNRVGLFSEQIDPECGAFLGNHPQALSHLSLVNAAAAISAAAGEEDRTDVSAARR
jgi:GH15 family glucan-1,4-alpha-glucosidase